MRSRSFFQPQVREGFYVSGVMKTFWASQFAVVKAVAEVCERHGILWFADYGTLLGAVRHAGYIPWDDDLDIVMLRHDYNRFLQVAKEELPEGYELLTYRTHKDPVLWTARVINSLQISLEKKYLDANEGCPFTVGIDIFVLDGLSQDEAYDEGRREKLLELNRLLVKEKDVTKILRYKEEAEDLCSEISSETAAYLCCMSNWVRSGRPRFPAGLYREAIRIPFENSSICVPVGYEEVLHLEFGDYMQIHKGGGMHEYPLYHKQELMIEDQLGKGLLRYQFSKKDLKEATKQPSLRSKQEEILRTLFEVAGKLELLINAGMYELLTELLTNMQELSIKIGEELEKLPNSRETVSSLESLCEAIFLCCNDPNLSSVRNVQDGLERASDRIKTYWKNRKKEIVFLVFSEEMWPAISDVYDRLSSISEFESVIVISGIYERNKDGTRGDLQIDQEFFDAMQKAGYPVLLAEEYEFSLRNPDMILTPYAYDSMCRQMDVPERLYSQALALYTKKLVYLPDPAVEDPAPDYFAGISAITVYAEQPAVVFSDEVWFRSERMRALYLETMTNLAGEETKNIWDTKFVRYEDALRRIGEKLHEQ